MNHTGYTQTQTNSFFSLKTLGLCIGLVALGVAAVTIFNVPVNTVFLVGILLACPLLHFWMMGGNHKH